MPPKILHPAIASLLLLLSPRLPVEAAAIRGPVSVSIDVVTNPVEGAARSECRAWEGRQAAQKGDFWLTVGEVRPAPGEPRAGAGSRIRCGSGSDGAARESSPGSTETPYIVGKGSAVAILSRQIEDDPLLSVDISLSFRRLSALPEGQEPSYQQTEIKRRLRFTHSREAFLPLLLADATEKEAFGIHEVWVSVAVRMGSDDSAGRYGSISIASAANDAEVLLDGGVAGRTSADGTSTLRNVPLGIREVGLRDPAGRETRKVVRVEAGRTSLAHFARSDPDDVAVPYRLTPIGKNAQGYDEYRRYADKAVVVKVPAGEFLMGNKETERSPLEHRVDLSEFLIDKTGVTWAQFKKFAEATGIPLPPHEPYWGTHDDHPAVFVTWEEARAYCSWAGGRLPTEAEREKAARGTDGRKYPWGNEEPDPRRGVFRRTWGYIATDPVGTHPDGVSPYGAHDLGGNVWEWCSDWYDDGYYAVSPARDPKGPASGHTHVVRGGSWDSRPTVLSCSCRNWGHLGYREGDFGFRCAMNTPK